MGQTQTNVIAAIKTRLEDAGLTLVQDPDWANTGSVYATDDLDPIGARLIYSFQTGYFTFGRPNSADTVASWHHGHGGSIAETVDKVLLALVGEWEPPEPSESPCHTDPFGEHVANCGHDV